MDKNTVPDLERARTQYSNERTLLAYVRTFIEFLLAAVGYVHLIVSILHFKMSWAAVTPAVFLFLAGIAFLAYGLKSYYRRKDKITVNGDDD